MLPTYAVTVLPAHLSLAIEGVLDVQVVVAGTPAIASKIYIDRHMNGKESA
jgi:hypothetical protein